MTTNGQAPFITVFMYLGEARNEQERKDYIYFNYHGTGFLQNMVRILTGTLLEVGQGKRTPESVRQTLEAKDRTQAGYTARSV